ncbi:hypothetical protein DEU56DRAFT_744974, partial [Suillus clintonianus]|uniref:uncharacterized protein n=1 Tax=Suillus clintonianus TaxID=1904413 RepID=UPI001B87F550
LLKKELINAQLQIKLLRDVHSKIVKRQRKYHLMEQLKGIKKELSMESGGKDKLIEKFKEHAALLKMPEGVHILPCLPVSYLTPALQIPWGQHTPDNYSITQAQKVLDEDHHSLKDVKDRILEFLPFFISYDWRDIASSCTAGCLH